MDHLEVRRISPDERREHILDIAHAAFMEEGYAGTSMSRIAAALGGSKTTLYNYFASKKDLFVAVAERECVTFLNQIFVVGEVPGDFPARIVHMTGRLLGALLAERSILSMRLISAEAGRFPELGHAAFEMGVERGLARMSEHLRAAIADGDLCAVDPGLAAQQLFDLAAGHLHRLRVWNVLEAVTPEAVAAEAELVANTFLAAFGNDALSARARAAMAV